MFGTIAVTDDSDGTRALRFGRSGVTQSVIVPGRPDVLHFVYARLMLAAVALVPQPRRILVVGLGGGALPAYLRRHFPATAIDVVEIDLAVAAVAREDFGYREDARLQTHIADGRTFIRAMPAGHYDVVLLDAFGSEKVPAHLTTLEFLADIRRVLAPGGVAASNLWNSRYNSLYGDMLATHRQAFAEVHVLDTRREVNHVVLALGERRNLLSAGLESAARRLSSDARLGFDLGDLVRAGYLPTDATGLTGHVLRDSNRAD
jgi:spermidine synthase